MRKLFDQLISLCALVAAYLFVLAGAMLTFEVIARYFFTKPTIWAAELSQMCLIWGTFLAMAKLLQQRKHIQVDAIVRHLPERIAATMDAIVMLIVAAFAGTVCYFGYAIFYDSFERGRTTGSLLNVPIWIVEFAVPLGFAFLFIQALLSAYDATHDARSGKSKDNANTVNPESVKRQTAQGKSPDRTQQAPNP